ncbi:hydantoinase/oxoprolinase family protein [Sneathiella litorea]|uniref:Hydantoinase/oxoprolinase family protein n=1 Tax=Sneathiella litorea TaxID=2606216 RepID=A0A6L8W8Q0_9PROT|nr:hydantoinase/oxoprolinase family protein [Sneathiella litorea]MZR31485.1 hydantoinase/oxoprolinase family protein [Sneathiella litorea]
MSAVKRHKIGVDIGGTFTDITLLLDDGTIFSHKLPSTPDDYSKGITEGVREILSVNNISADEIEGLIHATTVATNTILEYKGAHTSLVTTEGFRDVLEMRRLRIPVIYDLRYQKPKPLVPRRLRYEVAERMDSSGNIIRKFSEEDVEVLAKKLQKDGIEAVAICFLHAYANAEPEKQVAEILSRILGPDVYISRSSEVLPEIREYERTSTTVVNCYIGPIIAQYLKSLSDRLREIGLKCPIRIMHSAGGVMSINSAIHKPAHLVESGPAAGVIASAHIAKSVSYDKVISFDMGGTTAKAALIENGRPAKTGEYEVGAGINLSSKLVKGGGYPIKLPFIDVSEIGAGGGSIIAIDQEGRVSVGPASAGAMPGPVAYRQGGKEPTFTDALLTLGFINPEFLVGGEFELDAESAREALRTRIAQPLGKTLQDAAHGVLTLGVATMTRAIKAVSTYQGRDPREFTLVAFGGNGPVVAAEIARVLQIKNILIPPAAGVLSAAGLLFSDVEHEFVRTIFGSRKKMDVKTLGEIFLELEADAYRWVENEGYAVNDVRFRANADLRYSGQAYELTIPTDHKHPNIDKLYSGFNREHEKTYGHKSDTDPIDIINLKLVATIDINNNRNGSRLQVKGGYATSGERSVYFGEEFGEHTVPVLSRNELNINSRKGPFIIEEYDSTCVVPPYCKASLDPAGNILVELEEML